MSLDVNMSEPEEFNCVQLHSSIQQVANAQGYENFEYDVDCISSKGGNFIANVFRVVIKKTDNNEEHFSVIVKTLVNTERQVMFYELHKREVIAYNKIICEFNVVQKDLDDGLRLALPECLYANTEINNEVIILNDLKSLGFQIDDKQAKLEYLNFDQVNSTISALAKFHALSFVLEKREPERFEGFKSDFQDIIFQSNFLDKSKLRNYFIESFDMSLKLVTDKEAKMKLRKVKESIMPLLRLYTSPGKKNVLCHGDCWVNNILFKYEDSSQPNICFIDYQAMRYASPMTDLVYFLYICTDSQFRLEYFDQLKNTYYDTMNTFLSSFDIDVNKIYRRDDFISDLEDFLPYGLLIAMVELRIVTMTPEEDAILKGTKLASNWDLSQVPGESNFFRHRVNDLVKESVENGVLNKLVKKINF